MIEITNAYDAITSQGLGRIFLNQNQIVYYTDLIQMRNTRVRSIRTRIYLSTGQAIDVKETVAQLTRLIQGVNIQ